jgi:hypothetical protein
MDIAFGGAYATYAGFTVFPFSAISMRSEELIAQTAPFTMTAWHIPAMLA